MNLQRSDSLPARLRDLKRLRLKGSPVDVERQNPLPDSKTFQDFTDTKNRDEVIATWKALQSDVRRIRNDFPHANGGGEAIGTGSIHRALNANKNDAKKRITYDNRRGATREADRSSSYPLEAQGESSSAARRRTLLERLISWRTRECDCGVSRRKGKRRRFACTCKVNRALGERGRSKSVGYVPARAVAQFRRCNSAAAAVGGAAALRQRAALTLARRYYPEGGWGWTVTAVGAVVHAIAHGLQLGGGPGPIARNAAILFRVPPLHTHEV